MVETPASMADDSVRAMKAISVNGKRRTTKTHEDIQHCKPMRKANKTTGAVYCPSTLYAGCVSKRAPLTTSR